MSFIENKENELVYMTSSVIGARHAFTTRYGGVSEGIFSSLTRCGRITAASAR